MDSLSVRLHRERCGVLVASLHGVLGVDGFHGLREIVGAALEDDAASAVVLDASRALVALTERGWRRAAPDSMKYGAVAVPIVLVVDELHAKRSLAHCVRMARYGLLRLSATRFSSALTWACVHAAAHAPLLTQTAAV